MKFFGGLNISFDRKKDKEEKKYLRIDTPNIPDGALEIESTDYSENYSYLFELETILRTEYEQIKAYRDAARIPDADSAIDDIVNEAIVSEDNSSAVSIALDETEWSENIKNKIQEEFEYLLRLLSFKKVGSQIFRRWYVDGKQYFQKVIAEGKEKEGIKELNWLDPTKISKVREAITEKGPDGNTVIVGYNEYYIYDPNKKPEEKMQGPNTGFGDKKDVLKLNKEAISYTHSGIINPDTKRSESYIHNALKTINQLSLLEDSQVVYRLTRATERRVFYVDVGSLPKSKAEQYMKSIINRYRNKMVYDSTTGQPKNAKNVISMQEDIWLPRKEGSRGTEVDTLQGGQNLGEMEDVLYFRKKLYKALKIPMTRLETEASLSFDKGAEISREELKFSKFIDKLRTQFNNFFFDILRTQLLLKGIITEEDWEENKEEIAFEYNRDSYYQDIKKAELHTMKADIINAYDPYVGKYFSLQWLREQILDMSEEEMEEMDKQIEEERKKYGDPEKEGIGGYAAIQEPEEEEQDTQQNNNNGDNQQ